MLRLPPRRTGYWDRSLEPPWAPEDLLPEPAAAPAAGNGRDPAPDGSGIWVYCETLMVAVWAAALLLGAVDRRGHGLALEAVVGGSAAGRHALRRELSQGRTRSHAATIATPDASM